MQRKHMKMSTGRTTLSAAGVIGLLGLTVEETGFKVCRVGGACKHGHC